MILLRHGQSEFNLHFSVTRRDPGIIDPRLTPLGHQQAEDAARALADAGIERIITSPYTARCRPWRRSPGRWACRC